MSSLFSDLLLSKWKGFIYMNDSMYISWRDGPSVDAMKKSTQEYLHGEMKANKKATEDIVWKLKHSLIIYRYIAKT